MEYYNLCTDKTNNLEDYTPQGTNDGFMKVPIAGRTVYIMIIVR